MKQTFTVALKVVVDSEDAITEEEMVEWVKDYTREYFQGCNTGEVSNIFVGHLKRNEFWNMNVSVQFQLWLEERCKEMAK